jgi:rhodanese-related sulfurtransferase
VRTRSTLPKTASFPSEKPTLSGDAKVKKPNIPDGSRNGENVTSRDDLDGRISEIPLGKPAAVHCEGGYRSAIAASLLQKLGRAHVHDMVGGYKAWLAAKLPA